MQEAYTLQALPEKEYRALLGSAICVFNANNAFVIENILNHDEKKKYQWQELIDYTSGRLKDPIKETIVEKTSINVYSLFSNIVDMRNRIIHSFQVTQDDRQILATKDKEGKQFVITEQYLYDFIEMNEYFSRILHEVRGH